MMRQKKQKKQKQKSFQIAAAGDCVIPYYISLYKNDIDHERIYLCEPGLFVD